MHTDNPGVAPTVEPRTYRDAIGLFASGVTVITTRLDGQTHGMTANAVTSVSLDPTLLLICIDRRAHLHDRVLRAGQFAVNILAADQAELGDHFAGRNRDAPAPPSLAFEYGDDDHEHGVPTIAGCLTALRCTVEEHYAGGDHTIVIGRVQEICAGNEHADPLIWFGGNYRFLGDPTPD